jgi:hypothetical protein
VGSPWREPREESDQIYPGLSVNDGRVSGSIVIGHSRLPLWAIITEAIQNGWDSVEEGYEPSDYGYGARDLSGFLYWLLEARGELGRLLLAIANAERVSAERDERQSEEHFAAVHPGESVCECMLPRPPWWWDDPDLYGPVAGQLRRCLTALEGE